MSSVTPTRRELFLTSLLLIFLVVLSKTNLNPGQYKPPSSWNDDYDQYFAAPPGHEPATASENRGSCASYPSSPMVTLPQTKVIAHVPGWTILDRLYILNGTVYIVSDDPQSIPKPSLITSTSKPIDNDPVETASRLPTEKEMRIVSTKQAKELFGTTPSCVDGVSWLVNDPPQFIMHYYHWSAELFFGLWRTYSSLDPSIPPNGNTSLPPPRRMLFTHVDAEHWRDYARMNQWLVRSAFPSISMEYSTDWDERSAMGRPFVFDRVVFADRSAAMPAYNYQRTQRTASVPFALPGSPNWWSTIRNSVMEYSGLRDMVHLDISTNPVITYVSRQDWGRRMLIPEDHDRLVRELYQLREDYGYEVNVVSMDKLSRVEQLQLAGRTTILMGVHGNGLTSLVWMKPTPRSTVMEFFFPGGFAQDYEWTTRALGMVHYGFWGNRVFTRPGTPQVAYPEGFQGNAIPIDGAAVAKLCHERLILAHETDD